MICINNTYVDNDDISCNCSEKCSTIIFLIMLLLNCIFFFICFKCLTKKDTLLNNNDYKNQDIHPNYNTIP